MITQNTVRLPLLRVLAAANGGTLDSDAAVRGALAELGGNPDDKAHRTAVGNGKWELKARGCVIDAARGTWSITDLGRKALDGNFPPMDRDRFLGAPVARKTKAGDAPAPEFARAEEAPAPVAEAPAPVAEAPAPAAEEIGRAHV